MIRFDDWEKEIADRAKDEGSVESRRPGWLARASRSARPARSNRAPVPLPTLVLAIVAVFLVFIIASGTVWAFAKAGHRPASRSLMASGRQVPSASASSAAGATTAGKLAEFGDIGILRAATADKKIVTIVVQPYLSYSLTDVPFQEELVQKTRPIRAYILNWFHSKTIKDIDKLGESNVKSALLDGVNAMLVLGKVSAIYFSEYMVIE